jgi:hypothetical protein
MAQTVPRVLSFGSVTGGDFFLAEPFQDERPVGGKASQDPVGRGHE